MASVQVKVGEHNYTIDSIPAARALHVVRKMAGPISGLFKGVEFGKLDASDVDNLRGKDISLAGLGEAVASMPEKAFDEIVYDLLSRTRRVAAQGDIAVMSGPGEFVLADLDWSEILTLVWHAIRLNLSNFQKARTPSGGPGVPPQAAQPSVAP